MHKYQPRVHIVKRQDQKPMVMDLQSEEVKTFEFPETSFIAVTAYQNQLVRNQFKIYSNLFLQNNSSTHKTEDKSLACNTLSRKCGRVFWFTIPFHSLYLVMLADGLINSLI